MSIPFQFSKYLKLVLKGHMGDNYSVIFDMVEISNPQ
jgi:hypothetical protein